MALRNVTYQRTHLNNRVVVDLGRVVHVEYEDARCVGHTFGPSEQIREAVGLVEFAFTFAKCEDGDSCGEIKPAGIVHER